MSWADALIAADERVVHRSRPHWFAIVRDAGWAILAILTALALIALRAAVPGNNAILTLLGWPTLALFAAGIVVIGWAWLRTSREAYLVTTRRIIRAHGVVNRHATDSSLETIADAVLSESLLGRLLGFGDLDVVTAPDGRHERLRTLAGPKAFKQAMIEARRELAVERSRPVIPPLRPAGPKAGVLVRTPAGPPPPAPPPPGAGRLGRRGRPVGPGRLPGCPRVVPGGRRRGAGSAGARARAGRDLGGRARRAPARAARQAVGGHGRSPRPARRAGRITRDPSPAPPRSACSNHPSSSRR